MRLLLAVLITGYILSGQIDNIRLDNTKSRKACHLEVQDKNHRLLLILYAPPGTIMSYPSFDPGVLHRAPIKGATSFISDCPVTFNTPWPMFKYRFPPQ